MVETTLSTEFFSLSGSAVPHIILEMLEADTSINTSQNDMVLAQESPLY